MEVSWTPLTGKQQDVQNIQRLVIPAVSVGNVPQLALDLLLHNVPCRAPVPSAVLRSPFVLPCAGGFDLESSQSDQPEHRAPRRISTSLQLCELDVPGQSLHVIHQRAPVMAGCAAVYAKQMAEFLSRERIQDAVLLMSSSAAGRRDMHMHTQAQPQRPFDLRSRVWSMMTSAMAGTELAGRASETLGVEMLRGMGALGWNPAHAREEVATDAEVDSSTLPLFFAASRPGSFVRCLLEECEKLGFPLLVLVMFVHEGDNTLEATAMASTLCDLLDLPRSDAWKMPSSWEYVLGPPPSSALYM
ncbi:Proteasome assembly chaperone 2 [Porphyridium purpureum]|uniref:Proteasome assembly chaperone 2 n=1 Tax=Porphyridium purpureum TaxID=35688 RepID=A0A5J4YYN0_PORPP|nr:Proteasome assembly chaperone 2 [Porphyridium purpureum]|eukprot:POR0748..scf208_2